MKTTTIFASLAILISASACTLELSTDPAPEGNNCTQCQEGCSDCDDGCAHCADGCGNTSDETTGSDNPDVGGDGGSTTSSSGQGANEPGGEGGAGAGGGEPGGEGGGQSGGGGGAPPAPEPAPPAEDMLLWLDAQMLDLNNGSAVNQWQDKSGNGRDVFASSAAPVFQSAAMNGYPTVSTDGNGQGMKTEQAFVLKGDPSFTVTAAVSMQPQGYYPVYWVWGNPSQVAGGVTLENKCGRRVLATGWFHDAESRAGSFDGLWAKPVIVTMVKTPGAIGSTTRIFYNGTEQSVSGASTKLNVLDGPFEIGTWYGYGQSAKADYAEVIVYGKALADPDREQLECYLSGKLAIEIDPAIDCGE